MRTTIKDVARKARVAPSTVSLVLNEAPNVSPETRRQVLSAIQEMNYKPDQGARNFSLRCTKTVGLVLPPLGALEDPYYLHLLTGVLEQSRDQGYRLLLEMADERYLAERIWEELFQRNQVDALIIATPSLSQSYLAEAADRDYPFLLINGARPDLPSLDYMGYDDVRCGLEATSYLVGLGHRRIGFLGGPEDQASAVDRFTGYCQAMQRARIPFRPEDVLPGDYRRESAVQSISTLLKRPKRERPTALFSANDTMALSAMEVVREAGFSIPKDISILGVDDTGAAEKASPPLTTFRQDIQYLARIATGYLILRLQNRTLPVVCERLPMQFMERASCASLP